MKNIIVVTGGSGFVGSNLIENLIKHSNKKIISIDDYSSGNKKNHIKSDRITYINGSTQNIKSILSNKSKYIQTIFHFGEYSRIYQSFKNFTKCFRSNLEGTKEVILFCMKNNIKLIYSATSASLGRKGKDANLSPYAFTKSKNLELLENLKNWFNFKYEIIYFYNVYGPRQIESGENATVIGIFQRQYRKKMPLTIVKPGTQRRRFTHIDDTIKICLKAWKSDKCKHYAISNRKSYSIIEVAKMFKFKTKYIPSRRGERYASKLTKMNLSNTVYINYGKTKLKNYVDELISKKSIKNT